MFLHGQGRSNFNSYGRDTALQCIRTEHLIVIERGSCETEVFRIIEYERNPWQAMVKTLETVGRACTASNLPAYNYG